MTTSIQSLGGKARAASMTPEERTKAARHAATKGARKLGKEGRRLRALKGVATRKARHRLADNFVNASVGGMFSAGAQQARAWRGKPQMEALAEAVGLNGASVKVEQAQKPKRPPPKAGTAAALVIEVLRPGTPLESQQVAHALYYATKLNVRNTTEAYALVKNALSSLRSAGHVVSEPKPGSRREKLWRLA